VVDDSHAVPLTDLGHPLEQLHEAQLLTVE